MRHYADDGVTLYRGDALEVLTTLPGDSIDCCITSPPYFGLRDYGEPGQYGLESTPAEYVETMRSLFAEVRRVLADDGTLWLNLGDSYAQTSTASGVAAESKTLGIRADGTDSLGDPGRIRAQARQRMGTTRRLQPDVGPKNLLGIPWRVAFALQGDGWILRNAIIWHKPNAMPESVTDRLSCRYEHLFLFSKSRKYWFDLDPIREPLIHPDTVGHAFGGNSPEVGRRRGNRYGVTRPGSNREQGSDHDAADPRGRNPGDVWTIATQPFSEAHFAVMSTDLAERCVLAGCRPGGTVLDPFSGSGTTGMVAQRHGRKYVGIDLNRDYLDLSLRTRLQQAALDFPEEAS